MAIVGIKLKLQLAGKVVSLLGLFVFVVLTYKGLKTAMAAGQVQVYFEPGSDGLPPNSTLMLMMNSATEEVSFVDLEVTFDPSLVNLASDIITTSSFATIIDVSTPSEANASGRAVIVIALNTSQVATPPTGIFEIAKIEFTGVTSFDNQQANINFDVSASQIVNSSGIEIGVVPTSALLTINELLPTSTPMPSPTATPLPSLTPVSEGADLTLTGNSLIFRNVDFGVDLNLSTQAFVVGVDAVLLFDPAFLQVQSFSDSTLLTGSTLIDIDNAAGVIKISQVEQQGSAHTGAGKIGTVNFTPLDLGDTTLGFDFVEGSKSESNVIEDITGFDILNPPSPLILSVIDRASLRVKLTTESENPDLGHSVSGSLNLEDGDWSSLIVTSSQGYSPFLSVDDVFLFSTFPFSVKVDGYLKRRISHSVISGENTLDFGGLIAGDLNNDGIINNLDLALMYDVWFGTGPADYNKDGIVNSFDYYLLTKNFFLEDE